MRYSEPESNSLNRLVRRFGSNFALYADKQTQSSERSRRHGSNNVICSLSVFELVFLLQQRRSKKRPAIVITSTQCLFYNIVRRTRHRSDTAVAARRISGHEWYLFLPTLCVHGVCPLFWVEPAVFTTPMYPRVHCASLGNVCFSKQYYHRDGRIHAWIPISWRSLAFKRELIVIAVAVEMSDSFNLKFLIRNSACCVARVGLSALETHCSQFRRRPRSFVKRFVRGHDTPRLIKVFVATRDFRV